MSRDVDIQGFQKFVPGQLWFLGLNTEAITGTKSDDENGKLYLIMAANNRRIIVCRCTLHGEFASNWTYDIQLKNEAASRIFLDEPIAVSTKVIFNNCKNYGSFTPALFKDILKKFIAAMVSLSVDDLLENEKNVRDINKTIEEHEDRFLSFSKYTLTYQNEEDETEEMEEKEEPVDILKFDDKGDIVEKVTESTVVPDTIVEEKHVEEQYTEAISNVIDISDKTAQVQTEKPKTKTTHNKMVGNRDYIIASDVLIFKTGVTRDNEVYAELERLGIKNPKFVMSDLINRGKVTYNNNRYNVTLKSKLRVNPKVFGKEKYNEMAIADIKELGITNAAKIYNVTYNAFWKRWNDHCKAEVVG